MKLFVVATFALFATRALGVPPELAQDYIDGEFEQLALNQGGINTDSGACCEPTAAQCKIQVIAEGSDNYVEYHHNRTRNDSPQGITANIYPGAPGYNGKHGKQLLLQPGDDGGFVCAQYCPTDTDELDPLTIKKQALDLGKHRITQGGEGGQTKLVTEWYWTDRIIIIPLDHEKFYVDDSKTPVTPFYRSEQICPFGQQIAVTNTSFLQFIPGFSPTRIFNISGIDGCQKSQNCGDNPNMMGVSRMNRVWNKFTPTVMQTAQKMVAEMGEQAKQASSSVVRAFDGNVTFVSDYVATEKSLLLINQGGQEDANGNFCCNHSKLGQCQIQLQSLDGQHYVDVTNQRTRFEDVHNGITFNDYNAHKSYDVVHNDTLGVDMCVKFCPIDPDEQLDNQFLDDKAKDKGSKSMFGKTVEEYQWSEVILKIIKMSTTDFYADQTNTSAAVPVFQTQRLTPFGTAQIGSENHTWTDVKAGPVDPQKFNISGLDDCPQDPQCSQPSWQSKRVFFRQWATWASHMKLLR